MTEHNRHALPNTQVPEPRISPEVTHDEPDYGDDEPDDGDDDDASDSGLDSESLYSDSTSLSSSVTRYREENGRRYHSYGITEHWGPNDEQAQEQQDLSHHLWTLSLNGKLYLPPIDHLQDVLDMGTGTGIWAMDVADAHPEATIKGIDLSPIQPSWIPPNLKFEVDDYNLEWLDHNKFDLIHARELLGTVPSWPEMYRKVLGALKPGGWFQQADPQILLTSSFDTLGPDHIYHQWNPLLLDSGKKAGLDFDSAPRMKDWLEEAGFINVTEYRVPWPIGTWPKDPHQREIGAFNQVRIEQGVVDFCGRRLTNNLGWSRVQLEVFAASMRSAVKNNKLLAHHYVWFAYGQKPPASH